MTYARTRSGIDVPAGIVSFPEATSPCESFVTEVFFRYVIGTTRGPSPS
jgi:hypothetical protein